MLTSRKKKTIAVIALSFVGVSFLIKEFISNPCDDTQTFSVSAIDPRFGIATNTVIAYSKEAADIWNSAYTKNPLLAFQEGHGTIQIRFVYDERQRTTTANETLKQTIDEEKDALDDIKRTIESLKAEHAALERSIGIKTKAYNEHIKKHNTEVSYWNDRGGAPTDTYQRLQREESTLETERISLNADINRYNRLVEQIQTYGKSHNNVVEEVNTKIQTLNKNVVREFEEGTYDPNTHTITIYEYANITALKRVLIHELGHALSLNHVEDKGAIMYPVNEDTNLTLKDVDTEELMNVCREKKFEDVAVLAKTMSDDIARLVISSWRGIVAQLL